jgi:hypothetical protein
MVRSRRLACCVLVVCLAVLGCSEPSSGEGTATGTPSGDGDAMAARLTELERRLAPTLHTMMVEVAMRHAALWFAATYANWPFAGYQLRELEAALDDVRTVHPERDGVEIARLLDEGTVPALRAVDDAVEARTVEAFEVAFDGLTQACNDCHVAADLGAVRVQRPSLPPFTNLRYEP